MKKRLSTILLVLVFVIGLSLLLYPTISDYWNSFHQSRAIANYVEQVASIDTEKYNAMINDAKMFNESLAKKKNQFYITDEEIELYNSLLDISGNGVIGYIEIAKINVSLPIYHGVSDSVLQVAVGHIEGSSLPIGGKSTHCVISGHRGLPSAKLFTNLDKLVEGDTFTITVLNELLTYEIDQILIVDPEDMSPLYIEEGKDYCTLVTCTPYGINTHRMLVRGHRIENFKENSVHVTADATQIEPFLVAPVIAVPILLILMIWMIITTRKKSKKK